MVPRSKLGGDSISPEHGLTIHKSWTKCNINPSLYQCCLLLQYCSKSHPTMNFEVSMYELKLRKKKDMFSWEWEFLEVSAIQNEDIISWEWEFLEVSSICGGGGRKFVCG